jgi:hypothetical protein
MVEESLSIIQVKALIIKTIDAFPHQECATCECFLGYVTQLEMTSDQSSQQFLARYKPDHNAIHSCLGCDPCPPGDHYAEYLRHHLKKSAP